MGDQSVFPIMNWKSETTVACSTSIPCGWNCSHSEITARFRLDEESVGIHRIGVPGRVVDGQLHQPDPIARRCQEVEHPVGQVLAKDERLVVAPALPARKDQLQLVLPVEDGPFHLASGDVQAKRGEGAVAGLPPEDPPGADLRRGVGPSPIGLAEAQQRGLLLFVRAFVLEVLQVHEQLQPQRLVVAEEGRRLGLRLELVHLRR
jgi:hypothetical protein